jgi:hypothetical protein
MCSYRKERGEGERVMGQQNGYEGGRKKAIMKRNINTSEERYGIRGIIDVFVSSLHFFPGSKKL